MFIEEKKILEIIFLKINIYLYQYRNTYQSSKDRDKRIHDSI